MYATALRNFSLSCSLDHNKPLNGCVFLQALSGRRKYSLWIEDIQSRCGNAGCRVGRIGKALCQKYHHRTILPCWCLTALLCLQMPESCWGLFGPSYAGWGLETPLESQSPKMLGPEEADFSHDTIQPRTFRFQCQYSTIMLQWNHRNLDAPHWIKYKDQLSLGSTFLGIKNLDQLSLGSTILGSTILGSTILGSTILEPFKTYAFIQYIHQSFCAFEAFFKKKNINLPLQLPRIQECELLCKHSFWDRHLSQHLFWHPKKRKRRRCISRRKRAKKTCRIAESEETKDCSYYKGVSGPTETVPSFFSPPRL